MNRAVYIMICFFVMTSVIAQDLEKPKELLKGKGVGLTGMITANNRYYTPFDIPERQISFQYLYAGRLNLDIFNKIQVPASFSYANRNPTLSRVVPQGLKIGQSPNRFSLRPTYKGHTLYLGTNTLLFSDYSLSGHRFNGVGYEYASKGSFPIYGAVVLGRFLEAIEPNLEVHGVKPTFKRTGYGAKLGYKKEKDFVDFSLFRADDKPGSVRAESKRRLDSLSNFSSSNLVGAIRLQKVFYSNFYVSSEFSRSGVFRNDIGKNSLGKLFSETLSSSPEAKNAYKAGVVYRKDTEEYGVDYSRVDKNYKTFGSYFFNDNLETIALRSRKSFIQNKLQTNARFGRERGNLDKSDAQSFTRYVGSADISYFPSEDMGVTLNYSNFSNYTNFLNAYQYLRAIEPFTELDTLNYRQINQSVGGGVNFKLFEVSETKHGIAANAMVQSLRNRQGSQSENNNMLNGATMYTLSNAKKYINASAGVTTLRNSMGALREFSWGPALNASKGFKEGKYTLNGSLSYTLSTTDSGKEVSKNRILVSNLSAMAVIAKKHRITFSTLYMKTQKPLGGELLLGQNFSELTFNLNYSFSFKILDLKFK
jgi:hypothetical protein